MLAKGLESVQNLGVGKVEEESKAGLFHIYSTCRLLL